MVGEMENRLEYYKQVDEWILSQIEELTLEWDEIDCIYYAIDLMYQNEDYIAEIYIAPYKITAWYARKGNESTKNEFSLDGDSITEIEEWIMEGINYE